MKTKSHILILVENLPVPFDRRVWMESLALTEAGYRVSVISPQPPDDEVLDRVIDGIHVYRYPERPAGKGKLNFVREFWYAYWQTRRIAARIWQEHPFDVIHSCNPPDIFWHLARRYKRHGVKFVFDQHDLCPELYLSKYDRRDPFYLGLKLLERLQFRTADAVIATNESYRQIAIDRGRKSPDQVSVVRSGPLISRFNPVDADPALRRGRKHLCVYLGVMGCQDGVDYALRAIRHAIDDGLTDTAFTFIGRGDESEKLQALTHELGLRDDVHFTGRIPDDELKRYLSTAELGIAPDPRNPLNNVSTMNKIVEYMAMSLPIVSFDLDETRFSAGEAAVYVQNDDERAMGRAIINLLADPGRRQRMGRIGRARFERDLAWDQSQKVLVRAYKNLLSDSVTNEMPVPLGELGLWPDRADVRVASPAAARALKPSAYATRKLADTHDIDDPATVQPS